MHFPPQRNVVDRVVKAEDGLKGAPAPAPLLPDVRQMRQKRAAAQAKVGQVVRRA